MTKPDLDLRGMQERAAAWLKAEPGERPISRENAINEQLLALDVVDLIDEVATLREAEMLAAGPHCSGCANAIDPDWCLCGSKGCDPMTDGHHFVPMGCDCLRAELDWKKLATSRGELLWRTQRELAEARAEQSREMETVQRLFKETTERQTAERIAAYVGTRRGMWPKAEEVIAADIRRGAWKERK